ncbi:glycosyltransferase family 8 protein [Peniophora sp. CONT]|nr:glycosyltransferase family 8 protein [Peniophora sp. CONT]
MASPYAFATLLTSDSYLPGALTLAAALRDVHPQPAEEPEVDFQTVCLVTPETVDVSSIKLLRRAYDLVVGVEILEQDNERGLRLLGRPDLTTVLTKLHVFRLTQFKKIIFLDADILPTRPLSHLFNLPQEFSAVPDVGWPDIFNSGLMVLSPGEDKFNELIRLSESHGSWDGGDQGLINEWRGDDWNRLSFTYNTTPTAVYTYAPAYERFGKKISAIHFIGPNKPWNNIPWRAPGSKATHDKASEPLQVYDYSSLVDRWYAVYDKHYRSAPVTAALDYAGRRYEAAWDPAASAGADMPAPVVQSTNSSSGPFSLDDLRRMAIEGFSGPAYAQSGEGSYIRLPLEGRFDLMRPQRAAPSLPVDRDDGGFATATFADDDHFFEDGAAPVNEESPRSGYHAAYDLAQGTPFGYSAGPSHNFPWSSDSHSDTDVAPPPPRPVHYRQARQQYYESSASDAEHSVPVERSQGHRYRSSYGAPPPPHVASPVHSPERAQSPPMMAWNAALEPPPSTAPDSHFPLDTYFANAWDQGGASYEQQRHMPPPPSALFPEPPPSQIPKRLLQERQYANVIGDVGGQTAGSPAPNPTKIKPVFPWEEERRSAPSRIFPAGEGPPQSAYLQSPMQELLGPSDSPSSVLSTQLATPPQVSSPASPPTRTLVGGLGYMNAWDTVPSIQKYATRLVRPGQTGAAALMPAFVPDSGKGPQPYGTYESDSANGDDEETDDELLDPHERERELRRRSRSNSSAIKTGKKEYRSQGVQAVQETRNASVQVSVAISTKDTDQPVKGPSISTSTATRPVGAMRARQESFDGYGSGRSTGSGTGHDSPTTGSKLRQSRLANNFVGEQQTHTPSDSPKGAVSPRDTGSGETTPKRAPPPPPMKTPAMTRSLSMSSDALSTPSTVGPPQSPDDGFPTPLPPRRGSRVWDPARGVDVFKKGSEEVLARFLRVGSWEDEARRNAVV